MRRLLPLTPLLLVTVGCGLLSQSAESAAADAAREVARKAGERLHSQRPRTAEEIGRSAAGIDGVKVMRVKGASTHDGDGIDLVVRTSGSAYGQRRDGEPVTVVRCFSVRVSPRSEWGEEPRAVACPDSPPLTFAPPPEPPRLPYEELRAKLPRVPEGGQVDEAGIRRTLAALDLDEAIRTEVKADGGRVGILMSLKGNGYDPQDCLVAHVRPGATEVWVPSRIQRMPGEGGCSIGNALEPLAPPH
ncbi:MULTISPECIES: translation initiation factor IF-2 [Streptomyces]|uniref:translation initiation factor IF-2 n=1 Tax=Streptomyces TaxID=1883 RepID=UPI00103C1119|nr:MULTISPECIES: translation initiation factor IF-2 [Streptomyces]MBT3075967.1 translation initiation factor IF-2 [Streptomyces sp. COG21]MBT3079519.1 translation initiation factor IF-2 [Streptomyces sp. COG20]MBT3086657.1 translation initiation factor IF-2 [Streptomyces sp. CYG21]MBT3100521.1 translation initiation factor IF-2 [Streptomyces sp. CBG30]MBT3106614.1 translation initiation factor IF-2 [Streptomyces sp. COG19]